MLDSLTIRTQIKKPRRKRKVGFKREVRLVKEFVSAIDRNRRIRIATELPSANGIPDVVLFKATSSRAGKRLSAIPSRWAYALKAIPYRTKFSTAEFCKLTLVQPKTAQTILGRFRNAGFCISSGDSWIKIKQPMPVASEIIAVEAKLGDWQRALKQAYRYLDFANSAWVLLDDTKCASAKKNLLLFKKLNIGLASICSSDSTVKIHHVPKRTSPRSAIRFWQANAELASTL